jgi:hypothetical protein
MAERLNKPGNRSVATIDSKKDKWFKQMQQLGHIPTTYASLDDLTNYVIQLKNEGKTSAQISEATGADYRNVISNPMFQPSLSSSGSLRGMDMRAAREDIKPDEQLYMRDTFGPDFEKDVRRLRELEWGNKKPHKGENVAELEDRIYNAIRKASDLEPTQRSQTAPEFESAKTQADRSRDRLHAAFGKSKAAQTDRGHGVSAMDGAGVGNSNLEGEWGMGNRGHGSTPRYPSNDFNITKQRGLKDVQDPLAVLRRLNMSANDLQALGDGYLRWMGYDINPKRYSGNYLAADETYREMERPEITGKNNSTGNPQVTTPVEPNNVTAASIEWRDRRLEDAAQQRAVEIELETGVDSRRALAQARSEMNDLSYSKSFLYNTSNATANSGPVRSYNALSPEQHSKISSNNTAQGAKKVIAQQASAAGAALPVKTPKRIPSIDVKGSLGGAAPASNPIPAKPASTPETNTNLLRVARNTAPLWGSIPLSAMVAGQSAKAAVQKPSFNTGVDAAFDGVSLGLDLASLVPVLAGPAEAIQKGLIVPQAAWEGYKKQQASASKPTPIPTTSKPRIKADLSGKLSAAQIRSFQAGGGQAAMLRDGLTREQVIERGSALLLKQKYG